MRVERKVIEVPTIVEKVGVLGSSIPEWSGDVVKYLDIDELPEGKEEARRIRRRAARYMLIDGVLYKIGFTTLLLQCISPWEE